MMFKAKIRRFGKDLGVIIPKRVVKELHLKENDVVHISIIKVTDLSDIFGSQKRKMSGQKMKDMVRKGWD